MNLERERGAAFLLAPVLLGAGAIAYFSLTTEPSFGSLIAAGLASAIIAFAARSRVAAGAAAFAVLLFVLGMLAAKTETWRASTDILGGEISTRLSGRVVRIEHQEKGRVRLTLDVLATDRPVLKYAPSRVRVSARSLPAGMVAGSEIIGIVRLLPPSGPVRPGGYDFAFKSYFDGIGASGFFMRGPTLVAAGAGEFKPAFGQRVENFRNGVAQRIRDQVPGAEGEIAAALIVGVRAGIPEDVNEALRTTGLAHILSISGLHMALVAAAIMGVIRAGFALFPDVASRVPVKKYAAACAIAATAAYLFISGVEVAAERSFLMLAVMLTAILVDRAALTMRNLAIAAMAILVTSPHEVLGPSFQMSFGATAALVGSYSAWAQYRASRGSAASPATLSTPRFVLRKVGIFLLALVATSLVAGLATTVYGVYHFQRLSPLTLLANLAVMPIVSFLVMPMAVFSAFAMPVGLDGIFLFLMGKGVAAMIAVAQWFAARSPADAAGLIPGSAVTAFTIALIIATTCTTRLRALALPFVMAGIALVSLREFPAVFISEDATLVAVRVGEGALAVNRQRPNAFTLENWARAVRSDAILKPGAQSSVDADPTENSPFHCRDGLCLVRAVTGHLVAHAVDAEAARPACAEAAMIVIQDATAKNPCTKRKVLVISARKLAQSGSAAVTFRGEGRPEVGFAIERPYRPWHGHRRFSRAARGLPPYQRKAADPQATDANVSTPKTR